MKRTKGRTGKEEVMTVEMKEEIIACHDRGVRVTELANIFDKAPSTICAILKRKEDIKRLKPAEGVAAITKKTPHALQDVENLLLIWINEKMLAGERVTESIVCSKAIALFDDIVSKAPGSSSGRDFNASHGWYENFKKRSGVQCTVQPKEPVDTFAAEFKRLVDSEGYLPQQVFNCDEMGLFWKRMPRRTFLTVEEKAMRGPKPMKDRLNLLFCANASGDLKLKPLLVYHSETTRAFKKFRVQTSKLNVMWRSNIKARMTRQFFMEWLGEVFSPTVKDYLVEKNLPLKVLLVMDNTPTHPPRLEGDFQFIQIKFLPANITSRVQPMDQQVFSNFKKLYTKAVFETCFEVTQGSKIPLREYWKDHFHMLSCLQCIDEAWDAVTMRTLRSAWLKLWPDCVPQQYTEGLSTADEHVVEEIVSMAKTMGLEVNGADIDSLVEEHNQDLTTDELMLLYREQQQPTGSSSEDEEDILPSKEIREVCNMWKKMQAFVKKNHPNKASTMTAINLFNDNAMAHFHDILRQRQKQKRASLSLDGILMTLPSKRKGSMQREVGRESKKNKSSDTTAASADVFMDEDSPTEL
ncbi:tigger transposable element-derived protein 1-like [Synchiropus splendidus]|uniref:tigger transposable element-derived protein 1-like n=1 Tax=Synchiropus splendidus TaxID=270530 RepID=UPI00237D93E0|nr:tigger transposable element-derived protein 1-like [Synchiropus splendidus]